VKSMKRLHCYYTQVEVEILIGEKEGNVTTERDEINKAQCIYF
jgi:hypothetical protein